MGMIVTGWAGGYLLVSLLCSLRPAQLCPVKDDFTQRGEVNVGDSLTRQNRALPSPAISSLHMAANAVR